MYAVPSESDLQKSNEIVNNDFLIFSGVLMILLHIGLACMEASRTKPKYSSSIFFKIFLHISVCTFAYWLVGYGISFYSGNFFFGFKWWNNTNQTTEMPQWFYDNLVSATPVTILSSSFLERCSPIGFLINSVVISGFIHPITMHWVWNEEGWLYQIGYTDFSGSCTVFAFAGTACFITTIILGPRRARFTENAEVSATYSPPLLGIGAIFTLIGLLMFNCGSLYRTSTYVDGILLNRIVQNTMIAGAGGCIVALILARIRINEPTWLLSNAINGSLAGIVAICGAVNKYNGVEAVTVGFVGSLLFIALHYLLLLLKIDDPLDAFPVYFGGGVWGVIAARLLTENGLFQASDTNAGLWVLLMNFTGGLAICLWALIWSFILLLVLRATNMLQHNEDSESQVLSPTTYQDDHCYIEAIAYPYAISDKYRRERDVYNSHFNNSLRRLKMEANVYENMGYDMELQAR